MPKLASCLKPWCGREGALCVDCDQTAFWEAEPIELAIEPGPDLLPHDHIDYAKASRHARRLMKLQRGEFERLLNLAHGEVARIEGGVLPDAVTRTLIYLCTRVPHTVKASLRWPLGPDFLAEEVRRA